MIKTIQNKGAYSSKLTFLSRLYQRSGRAIYRNIPIIPSEKRYNITLCHEKKFIWFRVAKVGMSTILDLLARSNTKIDAEYPSNCHYPPTLYKAYFKFAMVRNPWDRLVSCWKDKVLKNNHFKFSKEERSSMNEFKNFVEYVSKINVKNCDRHIRLQSELIDLNNIDFIGRFENFNTDLTEVLIKLEIDDVEIEEKNVSNIGKHYKEYYDDELRKKVAKIYSKDIMLFSYNF